MKAYFANVHIVARQAVSAEASLHPFLAKLFKPRLHAVTGRGPIASPWDPWGVHENPLRPSGDFRRTPQGSQGAPMSPVAHWPMGPAGPRWVHQGDSGLYERYDPSIHADPSIFLDMCGVPFCSPGHVLSWDASLRPIRRCLCSRQIHTDAH